MSRLMVACSCRSIAGPRALYLDIARLTIRSSVRARRWRRSWASTLRPRTPTRFMTVLEMTARGQDDLVAGGGQCDGEVGPVRVGARGAVGGIRHRGP